MPARNEGSLSSVTNDLAALIDNTVSPGGTFKTSSRSLATQLDTNEETIIDALNVLTASRAYQCLRHGDGEVFITRN